MNTWGLWAWLVLTGMATVAGAQDAPRLERWTPEQLAQIERYYERISVLSRSSHWHHYDCCQAYRCFPARPGAVKWTPDGVAITHPDGEVLLYSQADPLWRPKKDDGLNDPRYHVCWEIVGGRWTVLCAYDAEVMG